MLEGDLAASKAELKEWIQWSSLAKSDGIHSAADMRHHFCPDDPLWRESVLFRSRQVITQALNGLVTTELL